MWMIGMMSIWRWSLDAYYQKGWWKMSSSINADLCKKKYNAGYHENVYEMMHGFQSVEIFVDLIFLE